MNRMAQGIKDLLDPILGQDRVWSDRLPDGTELPAAAILPDIGSAAALQGDAQTKAWRDLGQVDVWQAYQDEDDTIVREVVNALDGAELDGRHRLRVTSADRVPDPDLTLVHHAITVSSARLR